MQALGVWYPGAESDTDDDEEEEETWRQGRRKHRLKSPSSPFALPFSYKAHFKYSYSTSKFSLLSCPLHS